MTICKQSNESMRYFDVLFKYRVTAYVSPCFRGQVFYFYDDINCLTIRQRGRVVYEQIVDEGETRVDYLLIDNEAELSNCFSINHHIKYKLGCINKI